MPAETEFAVAWRPEPGDKVAGDVLEVVVLDRGWGPYPCLTLKTLDGEVSVHAFHDVLRKELAKRRPKIGDHLEITYNGKKESAGSASGYHSYRVVGGQSQEVDWGQWSDAPVNEGQTTLDVPIVTEGLPDAPEPPPDAPAPEDDEPLPF